MIDEMYVLLISYTSVVLDFTEEPFLFQFPVLFSITEEAHGKSFTIELLYL